MRNLKRALSLTLASVMLLGMMVVGSSAAAGYDDVADTDNVEAIEVLQAIEVMVGDERGFGPERPVNRAEMAVVMGKLLSLDYNYYEATCPFNDVYDWARGWVGACYANGIVSGRGEGVYDPGTTVTAVEAASMLMRALGYFKYQSDYANGFEVATVSQATKINLFDGVDSSTNAPLTRNQVAQMVLNALKSGVVEPDGNALNFVDSNGNVIATGGKVNYVYVTSNKPFATAIYSTAASSMGSANDAPIVELGERLFDGDLRLYSYTTDDFERPSRTWEYDGKEVGTYVKVENIRETYTKGVGIRALYDLLGKSSLQEYDFAYYVDGVLDSGITKNTILSRADKDFGESGNGVLTQVFVDTEVKTIDITSINTYLAQATADYNKTTESVNLTVFSGYDKGNTNLTLKTTKTVNLADVENITALTEDDFVLVNISGKYNNASRVKDTNLTGYNVVIVDAVEIMNDATLTKFSRGDDNRNDTNTYEGLFESLTTGGQNYDHSSKAFYSDEVLDLYDNSLLANKTYNVFLDKYGYAIGVDLYSGDDNYVFITGFDPSASYITLGNAKAAAIFTDGTMRVINVNVKDTNANIERTLRSNNTSSGKNYFMKWSENNMGSATAPSTLNRWYSYTVDANGEYTLTPAVRMFTTEITKGMSELDRTIKTNSVRVDEDPADMAENGQAVYNDDLTRAWGNDNSIFIVVETEEQADKSVSNIINDVTGVYTGVQNVEIDVTAKEVKASEVVGGDGNNGRTFIKDTRLYDSIYTLYDKNNYIIATVVVGEVKGGDANLAYILTAAKDEERLSDGTTVWTFDAIVDGKVVNLKTTSKFTKVISALEPGHVQELRYSGDYVTGVETPKEKTSDPKDAKYYDKWDAFTKTGHRIDEEEIYDVGHEYGGNGLGPNDCAILNTTIHNDYGIRDCDGHLTKYESRDLKVIGNTMYLNRDEDKGTLGADYGLALVSGAPAVVLQKVDDKNRKIECATVAQAIAELGDADPDTPEKEFAGRVVAVLDGQGRAKWVVFISDTPVYTTSGIIGNYSDSYVDGNWTFRTVNANTKASAIGGRVNSLGELVVTVPMSAGRSADEHGLEVTASINGVNYGQMTCTSHTVASYVYTYPNMNLYLTGRETFEIVVKKIANTDTKVEAGKLDLTQTGDAKGYTMTVNGAPYNSAKTYYVGDVIVITANKGYTVTVTKGNGTPVTIKDGETERYTLAATGNSLTINSVNNEKLPDGTEVDITITTSTAGDEAHVNVYTVSGGTYTLVTDGKVEVGDTIQVDPIEVLNVTGADLNADGQGKVTNKVDITNKDGTRWNNTWNMWRIDGATLGEYDLIRLPDRSTMRTARAISRAVDVDEKVDFTDPNWQDDLANDIGATYEQTAGGVTWTIAVTERGMTVRLKGTYTEEEIRKGLDAFDNGECEIVKTASGSEDPNPPQPTDGGVMAKIERNANGTISAAITEWDKDGKKVGALSADKVAAALNAADFEDGNLTFTAAGVTLNGATSSAVATDGTTGESVTVTLTGLTGNRTSTKATQVYKLTYPDGFTFVPATGATMGSITNIKSGVQFLLPKTALTGAGSSGVAGAAVASTVTNRSNVSVLAAGAAKTEELGDDAADASDIEYVAAVKLNVVSGAGLNSGGGVDADSSGSTKYVMLSTVTKADGSGDPIGTTASEYIQAGATVYVDKGTNAAAGKTYALKVDDKLAATLTIDEDGDYEQVSFTIPDAAKVAATGLTFAVEESSVTAPVYVDDDEEALVGYTSSGDIAKPGEEIDHYVVTGLTGLTLVYDNDGVWTPLTTTGSVTNGRLVITKAEAAAALDAETKTINLYTAWQVAAEGGTWKEDAGRYDTTAGATKWKAYTSIYKIDDQTEDKEIEGQYGYFRTLDEGTDANLIYVVASKRGTFLSVKGGTAAPGTPKRHPMNDKQDNGDPTTGVWAVPVKGNIATDSFEELLIVGANASTGASETVKVDTTSAITNSATIDLDKVTLKRKIDGVEVTWAGNGKDAPENATIEASGKVSSDGTKIQVTITTDTEITVPNSGSKEVGTVTVKLGDYATLSVPVTVTHN